MRRCRFCSEEATIHLRYPKMHLCEKHFQDYFERKISRTIKKHKMFSREDRILVAVSGGKDSLVVLYTLKKLGYNIEAVYLNLGIRDYSEKSQRYAEKQCSTLDIPLYIIDVKKILGRGLTEIRSSRPTCSICGTTKRYLLNKFAYDNDFSILITGHNLDDETSFVFSNLMHWNIEYLGRQGPVLPSEGKFIRKAKPLYEVTEREITSYAATLNIEYQQGKCPLSKGATIPRYKQLLDELEDKSPGTKINFIQGFLKNRFIFQVETTKVTLGECQICSMPSQGERCAFCNIWRLEKPVILKT